jgi:hypothetical protein
MAMLTQRKLIDRPSRGAMNCEQARLVSQFFGSERTSNHHHHR